MNRTLLLAGAAVLLASCSAEAGSGETLRISAASSLMPAMEAAEAAYIEDHPEMDIEFSFGSSGKLRTQIEQGAPADLFLSASPEDMKALHEQELTAEETVMPFASNRLVVASAEGRGTPGSAEDVLTSGSGMIAVGEPGSVPVGQYTQQVLEEMGLWRILEDRMVYAKDARQVLTYTESGNADLGIVYASDAFTSSGVRVLAELPEGPEPIRYPGAVLAQAANPEAASDFLGYLTGAEGQRILEEHGFLPAVGDDS